MFSVVRPSAIDSAHHHGLVAGVLEVDKVLLVSKGSAKVKIRYFEKKLSAIEVEIRSLPRLKKQHRRKIHLSLPIMADQGHSNS